MSPKSSIADQLLGSVTPPGAAAPRSLAHLGLADYPLQPLVDQVMRDLNDRGAPPAPSGGCRACYLDLMERIVRAAVRWQDASGAIVDPCENAEVAQTSPRYAAPGALLLAFGRIADLRESVYQTMDYACRRLAEGQAESPDFWMRELVTAWDALVDAPPARRRRWETDLRRVVPERVYREVRPDGSNLHELHNWTVYAAAGEAMRQCAGLAPPASGVLWGDTFFHKYMPAQLGHFTDQGMYRDPHEPITYDMTTRLQITCALARGYAGPLRDDLDELLRRGALTQLLYVSPAGYAPFGGRSSQFQFQEAILAAVFEWEARRYKHTDPALAGAFKRQARRSARSIERWLALEPFRHIKNGFDPCRGWGRDPYGKYAVYGLLCASFLGLAAHFADEQIEERRCPCEAGAFAFTTDRSFHKVLACCAGVGVEVDTQADPDYDATGLGRVSFDGAPIELGPGAPFTATPRYRLDADAVAPAPTALGPEWRVGDHWIRLAGLSASLSAEFRLEHRSASTVRFRVVYRHQTTIVTERYDLSAGAVRYRVSVEVDGAQPAAVRLLVPVLATDGQEASDVRLSDGEIVIHYRGWRWTIGHPGGLRRNRHEALIGNRNGLYHVHTLESRGDMPVELDIRARRRVELPGKQ